MNYWFAYHVEGIILCMKRGLYNINNAREYFPKTFLNSYPTFVYSCVLYIEKKKKTLIITNDVYETLKFQWKVYYYIVYN